MADNVTLPGATEIVAADDIGGGVKVQRAKVTWGPDGTANDADVATGKPLPVQLRGSDGTDRSNNLPVSVQGVAQVGGAANVLVYTPTVSASPDYSIDDVLGGKITLTSIARANDVAGVINFVGVTCDVDIPAGVTIDVLFFDVDPTNSTFTDNSALAVNVADLHFLIGVAQLNTRIDLGTPAMLVEGAPRGIPFKPASGTANLWAVMVVRGAATLNLGGTGEINLLVGVLQD